MYNLGFTVSRRKLATIMRKFHFVSNYTKVTFKKGKTSVNEALCNEPPKLDQKSNFRGLF